ncbi:hypothetical protein [[Clostridium] hylemonae]|uniref:hypothetical protein n=1 Tax=[Clostridium] hylemonae TaxID=89153 RepID=UPI001FCC7528|nr:hypothetical protein [[Clostridium] hylemonae]BDF04070.1 hypothetical protein CE91St63_11320 [[Clostridium] hylemonae]
MSTFIFFCFGQKSRVGTDDEETIVDLDAIAAAGKRPAKLVNGLVNLNRIRI